MRAAEAHQGIGGVTETNKSAAHFQIQIALWGARNADLPQVKDNSKKEADRQRARCCQDTLMKISRGNRIAVAAEKPYDRAPNTHKIPQMPKKNCQLTRSASLCPFLPENYGS